MSILKQKVLASPESCLLGIRREKVEISMKSSYAESMKQPMPQQLLNSHLLAHFGRPLMILSVVLILVVLLSPTRSQALPIDSNMDEISFDEVVRELKSQVSLKESTLPSLPSLDPYNQLKIHFSLGLIQSLSPVQHQYAKEGSLEEGLQLGMGVDLFSPDWVAEGLLKNFGKARQGLSSLALREFDMRLVYIQRSPQSPFELRISNGLGARVLRVEDLANGSVFAQTIPIYSLGIGFLLPIGSHLHGGFEIQAFKSLVDEALENQGLAMGFGLTKIF